MKMAGWMLLVVALGATAETKVQVDPAATKVEWTLGTVLHTVHGTFKLKRGDLWFDAATGKAGGALVVDALSGDSGSGSRDGRMHKSIIESPKFAEITFVPDRVDGKVNLEGDSEVQLHGMFTMHGGTHEMVMKTKSHIDHQKLTATLEFSVPYIQWGMKNPSTLFLRVNETVDVHVEAVGKVLP